MRETAGSAGFRLANGAVQTFNRAQRQAFAIISALLLPDADASDEEPPSQRQSKCICPCSTCS
jgi:hypothetical protein